MSKKLLVLAASSQQIDTITTAKRLGHYVITLDNRPENPGHMLADLCYDIDTTNFDAVLEVACREKIDGVIAACTDVAVPTSAYVAQKLHLKGPPLGSAQTVCNKVRFREFLCSRSFPVPGYMSFGPALEPGGRFSHGERWIMKPDQSSGSKGVFVVSSRAEFAQRAPETLAFSPNKLGILEEFIDGFQGTCEGFLKDGRLALACILDRGTAAPYVTTCGHSLPTRLPPHLQEMLLRDLDRLWKILEVTDGPFDCDFVATEDAVYLLEMSPRIGGNSISALLRIALGFDIVENSIRHALNEDVILPPAFPMTPSAIVIFGVGNAGRLRYDRAEADALRREPWVQTLSFEVDWDGPVQPFINSRHRLGYAIVSGNDRDDVDAKVAELKNRLSMREENG